MKDKPEALIVERRTIVRESFQLSLTRGELAKLLEIPTAARFTITGDEDHLEERDLDGHTCTVLATWTIERDATPELPFLPSLA